VRALADGVLFEFVPRASRILLCVTASGGGNRTCARFPDPSCIAEVSPASLRFDLPEPVELAQQEFDEELARCWTAWQIGWWENIREKDNLNIPSST